ncbi:MAG: CVNH domain-containing protein [Bdellovibrionales bacterium]
MKTKLFLFAALVASAVCVSVSHASHRPGHPGGHDSFRATCQVHYEDQFRIQAYCRTVDGQWVYNDFDRSRCVSGVANMNGRLTCDMGGWPGNPGHPGLPGGSYQASCTNCYMQGPYLVCQCRTRRGRWVQTSIFVPSCRTPIANNNGRLVCN